MQQDYDLFKIVVIGSMGTGKTNISTRYIRNEFNENQRSTVGVEFLSKIVQVRGQNIKVTLWDTAGQERYKSLSKVYYKGASGVIIVYDVTEPQSYLDVESWMRLANENLNLNEVALIVVGNKVDIEDERKVPTDRPLKEYKEKFDIDCWEVSARSGYNVKEVFSDLLEKIYDKTIGVKGTGFPEDDWGSVVDPSSIIAPTKPKKAAIQPVEPILEEPHVKKEKNVPAVKPERPDKPKEERITLNAKDDKRATEKKKEKKGGCC